MSAAAARKALEARSLLDARRLECSDCGAAATANCGCHAPYVPAGERAAKAVAENPEKSDRAIAAELGVSKDTIRRARKSTGAHAPVDEPRVGKDGKKRRKIEEYEHGSAPIGKFISKGSMRQGDLYKDTPQSMSRQSICHV